jgi:tRNA(Ile)-lysidine synthase
VRGLETLAADAFDRRLDPKLKTPIAVAFSGGGDSLAALLMTKAWADRHGRSVLVLNVDHRLQPQSADWSRFAAETAARLGADFHALSWDGPKPARGLAAAARIARHGLVAEAARDAGARVVVFGHTADDSLEGELMRSEGSRLGVLREWSPSPVWPQGRGMFLLRPLLYERRARIREILRAAGEVWIDDPANIDPRSPRARARARLQGAADPDVRPDSDQALADLARSVTIAPEGFLRIDREALRRAPGSVGRRLLAAGVVCAGGGTRPPRGDRLDRLFALSLGLAPFQATLCGCKIIAADDLILARDAGEIRRGGLAAVALQPNTPMVWDGRFELIADRDGLTVRALAGAMAGLDKAHRRAVQALPALIRPSLPVVTSSASAPACPILACDAPVRISALIAARFLAACGAISKEPAT